MITYNPKDWFRLIFQFHRSDTFRILLPTMVLLGAATGGVVYMQQNGHAHIRTSAYFTPPTLVQPNFSVPLFPLVTCRLITEK